MKLSLKEEIKGCRERYRFQNLLWIIIGKLQPINYGFQSHFYYSEINIVECLAKDSKLSASWEATQANLHYFFCLLLSDFVFYFVSQKFSEMNMKTKSASKKWKVVKEHEERESIRESSYLKFFFMTLHIFR